MKKKDEIGSQEELVIKYLKKNKNFFIKYPEIIRGLKSTCLHAYIVKSHYYDKLIANFSEGLQRKIIEKPSDVFSTYNVDVYISKVQYYDHWIAPMTCLATQKEGWSDNFNRSYDHGHFKNHFHPIFKKK